MPLRVKVLFNMGPAFGGFRFAIRPGASGRTELEALEKVLEKTIEILREEPFDQWPEIGGKLKPVTDSIMGSRSGYLDFAFEENPENQEAGDLVIRASLPFRFWPFGCWAVYMAWKRDKDGTLTAFADGELDKFW